MSAARRVGWIGAFVAAALASASLGYQMRAALRDEPVAVLGPAIEAWDRQLERDRERLIDEQAAVARWHARAASELSRMEARIVQLESTAVRLVDRTGLDGFDFRVEPAVGGPEEGPVEHASIPEQWNEAARGLSRQIADRTLQMQILEDVLKWRDLRAAVMPDGRPVQAAYVSSRFGPRIDPFTGRRASHKGIDFAGALGTEVVAVAAGIVTWSGERTGYGELVEIDHGNGLVTRYAHNSNNLVEVGDVVTRGQSIALLGATGRATGPNLHFEVVQDGEAVDPLPFIE